jgi:environmental stress-induced protein Ves
MTASLGRPECFDLAAIAPQPWKNGCGTTRELALCADDSAAGFGWRVSVAEVERDAPFSAFVQVDRCIVLLQGGGLKLVAAAGALDQRLDRRFEPFCFAGDLPVGATLIAGPCRDLNVMTRRGAFRSTVTPHTQPGAVAGHAVTLLFCAQGTWQIDALESDAPALRLAPMQALLWRWRAGDIAFRPTAYQDAHADIHARAYAFPCGGPYPAHDAAMLLCVGIDEV